MLVRYNTKLLVGTDGRIDRDGEGGSEGSERGAGESGAGAGERSGAGSWLRVLSCDDLRGLNHRWLTECERVLRRRLLQAFADARYREKHPKLHQAKQERANVIDKERRHHLARAAVARAIQLGVLERALACETCHRVSYTHAHHYVGYAVEDRLKVQWLCSRCHYDAHVALRRGVVTGEGLRDVYLAAHPLA